MPVVIETERLLLRHMELEDLDAFAQLLGSPEVMRYYPRPKTRPEAQAWIEANRRRYERDGYGLWTLVLKADGSFAGDCGLTLQLVEGREELEVGYHLLPGLWGRGLATEAAAACRDHARRQLHAERLVAIINPANLPSQRVALRIGLQQEREAVVFGLPQLIFETRL